MIDVSARKEAEHAATETELRYRDLAEQVPGVIYIAELDARRAHGYRLRYVSPQLTQIFGYEPADWADTERWLATVHPDDRERVRAIDAGIADRPRPSSSIEYRIFHRDGSVRWVRDQGARARTGRARSPHRDPGTRRGRDGRPQDRPGAPRGPRAVPLARRGDPGHHLPRAREPGGAGGVAVRVRQPADRADPRVHPGRGDERPALLRADPAPGRPAAHPGGQRAGRVDGRAVRRGVPTADQGRRDPLDARSRGPGPRRRRRAPVLARGDDRHHRPQGGRAQPPSGRGALPHPGRTDPGGHVHRDPGGASRRDLVHLPEPPGRGRLRVHERGAPREPQPPRRARPPRGPRARLRRERSRRGDRARRSTRSSGSSAPTAGSCGWTAAPCSSGTTRAGRGSGRGSRSTSPPTASSRAATGISPGWSSASSASTPTSSFPRPAVRSAGARGGSRAGTGARPWGARRTRPRAGSSRGSRSGSGRSRWRSR